MAIRMVITKSEKIKGQHAGEVKWEEFEGHFDDDNVTDAVSFRLGLFEMSDTISCEIFPYNRPKSEYAFSLTHKSVRKVSEMNYKDILDYILMTYEIWRG